MALQFRSFNSPLSAALQQTATMYGIDLPSYATTAVNNINTKYNELAVYYLDGIETEAIARVITIGNMQKYFPTLLSLTNNLKEISSIPVNDSIKKTVDHSGDTFSMSENQPIDATEDITTPYIKVKGRNGYNATDTTEHNTVEEAKVRNDLAERAVYNLSNWLESMLHLVLQEYNTLY